MKEKRPKCSNKHIGLFGADDEARTRYLHLGKVALYQMSYIRIAECEDYYILPLCFCQ